MREKSCNAWLLKIVIGEQFLGQNKHPLTLFRIFTCNFDIIITFYSIEFIVNHEISFFTNPYVDPIASSLPEKFKLLISDVENAPHTLLG